MCEAYTGIAGGAFDDSAAGFQKPALFGIADYVEGCAVFDAAAGILEFGFAEDCGAGLLGEGM